MHGRRLILRSLAHYWRTHLGVGAGVVVATAVLVGALLVGDSVSVSLEEQALRRVGRVELAMHTGDRYFTDELAGHLTRALASAGEPAAAGLELDGVAIAAGGRRRTPDVRVYGIDPSFWALGGVEPQGPREGGVVINRALAKALSVELGDELLLRVAKPSALPRDVPLGSDPEDTVTVRVAVEKIVEASSFGDFDLETGPLAPLNAFVDRGLLARRAGLEGRANWVLSAASPSRIGRGAVDPEHPGSTRIVPDVLRAGWRLEDASARLRRLGPDGPWDLSSERVFLSDALTQAALSVGSGRAVSTYFVNSIEAPSGRSTRYAMVAAYDPGAKAGAPDAPVPSSLAPGQIVVTEWLARELEVKPGDELTLRYWIFGLNRHLTEATARFEVARVVETEAAGGDRWLMPDLPGMTDVESMLDWAPAPELEIRTDSISDSEKAYWKLHRGAPKAFVSLAWAERDGAWRTPYGAITSVRFPGAASEESLRAAIRQHIDDPTRLGLGFEPVRGRALEASREGAASYFGYLFVGLGAFVIVAAVTLTSLLFSFNVEQRVDQIGTLLAIGFPASRIRRLLIAEGMVVAGLGGLVGLPAGWLYAQTMVRALSGSWSGALADAAISFHATWRAPIIGLGVTLLIATSSMWRVLRRQVGLEPHELMAERFGTSTTHVRSRRHAVAGAWCCAAVAVVLAVNGMGGEAGRAAGSFFGAGAVMLAASLLAAQALVSPSRNDPAGRLTFTGLGRLNGSRRPGRSLATVAMLASGVFLIVAVNAFRLGDEAVIGTGGFGMFAKTSVPVAHELSSPAGAAHFGLQNLDRVHFLSMRLRGGDEASCRNLNRPQSPPVLGVDARAIEARNPFRFRRMLSTPAEPWALLERPDDPGVIPGIVDDAVAQWVLKVGLGDTIDYLDEAGRAFRIRIVGTLESSILQGYVVIDARAFAERFPSVAGNRVFLVDLPSADYDAVDHALNESALQDYGLTTMAAGDRLAAFNAVQNTYLSIFSALGGLGLVLGCVGLAFVVLRNVLERRGELALLRAVGFSHRRVLRLVLIEHWGLLVLGAGSGIVAAMVAVGPGVFDRGRLPLGFLAWTVTAVIANGLVCTTVATVVALRGDLVTALRSE